MVVIALSDGVDTMLVDVREHSPARLQYWLKWDVYDRLIIGHNLAFDLNHLHENFDVGYPERIYDTMVAEQNIVAGLPEFDNVGLDDVLARYTNTYLDKSLQTSFRIDEPLTPEQVEYALGDVMQLPHIRERQLGKHKKLGLSTVFQIEMHALPGFAEMTRVGVWVDMEKMGPLLEENRKTRDRLKRQLQLALTPIIMEERTAKRKQQEAERAAWQQEFDNKVAWYEEYWGDLVYPGPDGWSREMHQNWIDNKWLDDTIDKKDGKPKGMKRYVRHMMSAKEGCWRYENPITKLEPIDTELINLNSSKQVLYVFHALGLDPVDLDGKETTGKKTLEAAIADATEEQRDILIPYLQYRKAEKIDTAFGQKLIDKMDEHGRLHAYYKQVGTQTGRPAALQPNMNQMPNDPRFRSCFRAEEGDVMVVSDYQQMELRLIAQLSGDKNMQAAFNQGKDLHVYTAALMFGVAEEDVSSKQRKTAKTINFGILYGMGPKKLRGTLAAEGIDMTYAEALDAIKKWKKAYAQADAQIQAWGQQVLTQGYTETPFGRKRFFSGDFTDDEGNYDKGKQYAAMRQGANHPIQGTNADITKIAMAGILRHLGEHGEIILQVYDEIVVQCRERSAEWVQQLVVTMMTVAAEQVLVDIPAGVDSVISRSWNEEDAIAG
jgi:DNA polymerase I-like protein with 3'-5' exonuclease and polymerase domains